VSARQLRACVIWLGCDKNRVYCEEMLGALAAAGLQPHPNPEDADVIVVNTCAFIEDAAQESVDAILRCAQYRRSGRCQLLAVVGCLPARYGSEARRALPEVDLWLGANEYHLVARRVWQALHGQMERRIPSATASADRILSTPAHYGYLLLGDGCDRGCSYCTIPAIKGKVHSRPLEEVLGAARKLAQRGVGELILVAQDTTSYGRDVPGGPDLVDLLVEMDQLPVRWIRLMYAHPAGITPRLLRVMAGSRRTLPYLDIPFQHASPRVLRRMGRADLGHPGRCIAMVRNYLHDPSIRATFMVGHPGEGWEDFLALLAFVRRFRLDHVGVFAFSPEEGTAAARMRPQVPVAVRERRRRRLIRQAWQVAHRANRRLVGMIAEAVVEEIISDGLARGRIWRQAPEVDGITYIFGRCPTPGTFVKVRVVGNHGYDLFAELLPPSC